MSRRMLPQNAVLMSEWDYEKNGALSPMSLTTGSGKKVWWKCEKGHSWEAAVNHRNHGTGCPYCSNRMVQTGENDLKTVNPVLAAEWNYARNGALAPENVVFGSHRKVWWRCSKGHEWRAEISSRAQGYGCPCCSGKAVVTGSTDIATMCPELANEWVYEKNNGVKPEEVCHSSNKRFWWRCKLGHEWMASPSTRVKSGCPVCAGKQVLPGFNDLATLRHELVPSWSPENELTPSEVTVKSGKTALWRCEKGHEWKSTIAGRSNGNGCPYCSGRAAIPGINDLKTVRPDLAAEWDYALNGDLKPENLLPQSNVKVWWRCSKGHGWKAPVFQRHTSGCPFCTGNRVIEGENDLLSNFPSAAREWDYEANSCKPEEIHAYSNKYAWWRCEKGHSWKAVINNRTSKGRGCPYCAGFLAITGETDLLTKNPDLAKEWDYEKNTVQIEKTTEHAHVKVWWRCKNGHSWYAAVNSRSKGNGCPYCAGQFLIKGVNDLLTLEPALAEEWDFEKNTINIDSVMVKSNRKVWWKCKKGHSWQAYPYNRVNGSGCPYCAGIIKYNTKLVR